MIPFFCVLANVFIRACSYFMNLCYQAYVEILVVTLTLNHAKVFKKVKIS